ncbi:hypothetical protein HDU67_002403 [Dinochytrium kinnereticum]|nr:hypothetical protein HDU67_002403 [Dinochytrium kinnereticum]
MDDFRCRVANIVYIFCNVFTCAITSCLAVSLLAIATFCKDLPSYAFIVFILFSVVSSLAFSVPLMFIDNVQGSKLDGCWFSGEEMFKDEWIYYYGPITWFAAINLACAVTVYVSLMYHNHHQTTRQETLGSLHRSSQSQGNDILLSLPMLPPTNETPLSLDRPQHPLSTSSPRTSQNESSPRSMMKDGKEWMRSTGEVIVKQISGKKKKAGVNQEIMAVVARVNI